jgi:polyisoprenoid-binding protein YceI
MKHFKILFATFLALISLAGMSFRYLPSATFNIDTKASSVNWKGYKVTGEHFGTISVKSGSLQFEGQVLVGGSFEIDMKSINVTDLQGGGKTKLEGHLKSDDFFGSEKYPVSKFKVTKVISKGIPGAYKITGNITIKETTKEIKFDAKVVNINGKITAEADIRLDRSEFDVRYGSGSFFDSLGDKTIYDEFDLKIKLVSI